MLLLIYFTAISDILTLFSWRYWWSTSWTRLAQPRLFHFM